MSNRKVILSMQITLDGYVAGTNDEMDWISSSDEIWAEMFKDLESVDTYLLGRKMFDGYRDFWTSALNNSSMPADLVKFAGIASKTQHIVFSHNDFDPKWDNTRVAHDPKAEIARLKKQDGKDIMAWGGAGFASELINLGLIDEYRLTVNPVLLGKGKALFGNLKNRSSLKLIGSKQMAPGCIILRYQ